MKVAAAPTEPAVESGLSSEFGSAEIDNSRVQSKHVNAAPSSPRPDSKPRKLPPAASGEDSMFSDESEESSGEGGRQAEPSLAGLKTPASSGRPAAQNPKALSLGASESASPELLPSDSVDFNAGPNSRASLCPPADNSTKGVAVDLGEQGGVAWQEHCHLD